MNAATAYNKGYEAGQRQYSTHPELDKQRIATLANQSFAADGVRLAQFADYRDGFVAGYMSKKNESEVK